MSLEELAKLTSSNACRLFRWWPEGGTNESSHASRDHSGREGRDDAKHLIETFGPTIKTIEVARR